MTSEELATYVGKVGLLNIGDSFAVDVKSLDARESFGRLDILIEPVAGVGLKWVAESRISWNPETP